MARSINRATLLGNLTKDGELKFTPSGVPRISFTVATSRRWKDQQTGDWKEEADFHNVTLWRNENIANHLTKGKQVYVEGRISHRSYEDKDGTKKFFTEVVADDVVLLGGGGQGESAQAASAPRGGGSFAGGQQPKPISADMDVTDDDVPFIWSPMPSAEMV